MAELLKLEKGKRFGRLTVDSFAGVRNGYGYHWCVCKCGWRVKVQTVKLNSGNTRSCGCARDDKNRRLLIARNHKHGKTGTRLYRIWHGMLQRCHYEKHSAYHRYGGREPNPVHVCYAWRLSFMAFYSWAKENGYKHYLTLDRIKNAEGYEPSNCRWVGWKVQRANQG